MVLIRSSAVNLTDQTKCYGFNVECYRKWMVMLFEYSNECLNELNIKSIIGCSSSLENDLLVLSNNSPAGVKILAYGQNAYTLSEMAWNFNHCSAMNKIILMGRQKWIKRDQEKESHSCRLLAHGEQNFWSSAKTLIRFPAGGSSPSRVIKIT